jgi:PPK2 family polyphosphate:nucleotide phosphotransferase
MSSLAFVVPPGTTIDLAAHDPAFTGDYTRRRDVEDQLRKDTDRIAGYQTLLYAQKTQSVLVILQSIDTAGKDSLIKHVMTALNPQGTIVTSFKAPSLDELGHGFLWRSMKAVPARGEFAIHNRSHYEEVLAVRVHREFLALQGLPPSARGKDIWRQRFTEINDFERYLVRNGTVVLKFFLHLSRGEQKRRLLERIDTPEKNWKFALGDIDERRYWREYQQAFEAMLTATSTRHAPWHIVPADHKWFTRTVVARTLVRRLKAMKLAYPALTKQHAADLATSKRLLTTES